MRWALLVVAILAGCAYKAGSATETTREVTAERTTVGCLEVAVDRRHDLGTTAVVRYAFENRCAERATVDLGWAQVIGRTADGAELALVPTHAAGVVTIDPHTTGEAALAYPAPDTIGQLCVDVASLAQQTPAQWRCFGNPEAVASR